MHALIAALVVFAALAVASKNDVEAFEQTQAIRFALSVAVQGKDDPSAGMAHPRVLHS
jgi:hypothetical protein